MEKTEISCGAVVYTRVRGKLNFVIIKSLAGDVGFPKGHVEGEETEEQTALREIYEEVGLRVNIVPGFRVIDQYPLPLNPETIKRVVYFVAEYSDQNLVCQREELSSVTLMPYNKAMKALTFDSGRNVLEAAMQFIAEKEKENI